MDENYVVFYMGSLNPIALRKAIRFIPNGLYRITIGCERREVPHDLIISTVEEKGWGGSKGEIEGPIKLEELIE